MYMYVRKAFKAGPMDLTDIQYPPALCDCSRGQARHHVLACARFGHTAARVRFHLVSGKDIQRA